jgi:hypothetical protein
MTSTQVKNPTPSTPLPNGNLESYHTLYYRLGRNPHAMAKNFYHVGTLHEVVARAKKHCEILGARFVRIEPLFSNLDSDERQHMGTPIGVQNED